MRSGRNGTQDAPGLARTPLSRERVLAAAVDLADAHGVAALTIRSLAAALGVKPMSLYHHVANKEAILDGIVDAVFSEIDLPPDGRPWREALTARMHSARRALLRHPWAVPLMESRSAPGPARLRRHECTLAVLREAGFSVAATAHAYAVLDAHLYGSVLQETSLPFDDADSAATVVRTMMEDTDPAEYPYMMEMATEHVLRPGYDFGDEFAFGLRLILDGLERLPHRGRD